MVPLRGWGVSLLAVIALMPTPVAGQRVVGRVLEDGRGVPVPGAIVSLLDREGRRKAEALADSVGRFSVVPPEDGEYLIEAVRLGYEMFFSPLVSMKTEGRVELDLVMRPLPIGLEGLEVEVESESVLTLRRFGQTPATLGARWIDRKKVDKVVSAVRVEDILRWQSMPGVSVDVAKGSPIIAPLCVRVLHGARAPCALTVLNGMVINAVDANQIDPGAIDAIAVLSPSEAAMVFGTQGGAGAVLIWLR